MKDNYYCEFCNENVEPLYGFFCPYCDMLVHTQRVYKEEREQIKRERTKYCVVCKEDTFWVPMVNGLKLIKKQKRLLEIISKKHDKIIYTTSFDYLLHKKRWNSAFFFVRKRQVEKDRLEEYLIKDLQTVYDFKLDAKYALLHPYRNGAYICTKCWVGLGKQGMKRDVTVCKICKFELYKNCKTCYHCDVPAFISRFYKEKNYPVRNFKW